MPALFAKALNENLAAKTAFDNLSASRRLEIVRYLANLKTEQSLVKTLRGRFNFLLGKETFVGRKLEKWQTCKTLFALFAYF